MFSRSLIPVSVRYKGLHKGEQYVFQELLSVLASLLPVQLVRAAVLKLCSVLKKFCLNG